MSIKSHIQDLRCELEELAECGDLEERLETAMELARLEKLLHGYCEIAAKRMAQEVLAL